MANNFNGTTLTISAAPTAGAKLPSDIAGNVAGIAIIDTTMYCVKTTGLQSALYKTDSYTSNTATATCVEDKIVWPGKSNCFALGLTKIGNYLYVLAEDHKGYGGSTTILKMNANGTVSGTCNISGLFPNGALGITAADGKTETFIILGIGSTNDTLTFKKIKWGTTPSLESTFSVKNKGYGYTYQLQDIYYNTSYGLFILTNNTFSTLQNSILVVDYNNSDRDEEIYTPAAVIKVEPDGYNQYNLESVCMKANKLVLASNITDTSDNQADRFSILNGITYANGTYSFKCALKKGMKVNNKTIGGVTTTNFGTIAFNGNTLYGIKAGSKAGTAEIPGYSTPSVCAASLFKLSNYTTDAGTKNDICDIQPENGRCLYHANGMDYYDGYLYVACGEPVDSSSKSFVKISAANGKDYVRYNSTFRTNAISHYDGSSFIALTEDKREVYNGNKWIYPLHVGHFSDSSAKFVTDETYYFLNTGYDTLQDIYYTKKYGLFVVTCDVSKNPSNGEYQTKNNRVLHLNLNRTKVLTADSKKKYTVVIPDFAFDYSVNLATFFSFEMESVAVDPVTKKMIVAVNANSPTENSSGKHSGEDYICSFSTMTFS
ncbi:MAG: hypothetical protein Q4C91_17255 [Eubacteriales bacterium]|nr:hypothetical protein [Eubacteriales bacterium]